MENYNSEKNTSTNSTSEVGFTQNSLQNPNQVPGSEEEKWRTMFEQQNRSFLALVEALKPSSSVDTYLPEFNPDVGNADARAWLSMANMCISDQSPEPSLMKNSWSSSERTSIHLAGPGILSGNDLGRIQGYFFGSLRLSGNLSCIFNRVEQQPT